MVAIKPAEVDRFIAKPDPARPILLVYGADAGLVRERSEALIRSAVDDPDDPFQLVRLEGDELAGAPARLIEEASTIPLFGGRRAIWIRAGSRNFAPAVEALLGSPAPECRTVIEAGELRRSAPLRAICERARNAVVLACYPDSERDLVRLIDEEMRQAGLTVSADARNALVALLGGDRIASRHELRKLALYARGKSSVELADVTAVVADASILALDDLLDAAFAGRTGELEVQLGKIRTAGIAPGSILSAAVRQVAQLHKARLAIEEGASVSEAGAKLVPPVHFSRKPLVEAALRMWTATRLGRVMAQLAEAAYEARRQSAIAELIAQRAVLAIALNARRQQ
jgi:DNA polymerase-3 subunit delta